MMESSLNQIDCNTIASNYIKHDIVAVNQVSAWMEQPFKRTCTYCLKSFEEKWSYLKHDKICLIGRFKKKMPKGYGGPMIFSCGSCSQEFKCENKLVVHHKEIHLDKYVCTTCNRVYPTKESVVKHSSTHSRRKRIYKCCYPGCSLHRTFKTKLSASGHLLNVHFGHVVAVTDDANEKSEIEEDCCGHDEDDDVFEELIDVPSKPEIIPCVVEIDESSSLDDEDVVVDRIIPASPSRPQSFKASKNSKRPHPYSGTISNNSHNGSDLGGYSAISINCLRSGEERRSVITRLLKINIVTDPRVVVDEKHYSCSNCMVSFPSESRAEAHIKIAHSIMSYTCMFQKCGKRFQNLFAAQEHLSDVHLRSINKRFKCVHVGCWKTFLTKPLLDIHVKDAHSPEDQVHASQSNSATVCLPMKSADNFTKSARCNVAVASTSKAPPNPLYACRVCPSGFDSSIELELHTASKHPNIRFMQSIRPYSSKACAPMRQSASVPTTCIEKEQIVVTEQLSAYQCPICSFRFSMPSYLQRHYEIVHEDDASHKRLVYRCPSCPQVLRDCEAFRVHIEAGVHFAPNEYF